MGGQRKPPCCNCFQINTGPLPSQSKIFTLSERFALHIFETIKEVQDIATDWLWTYNHERPNMGIGGITPAQKLKRAA